ncbi:MAG: hypothetical protein ABSB32_10260 [Thermodesulfobacteriota bacterium]|jgi:hypothetical protein
MNIGWIKLYRQLITNDWLKNKNVCIFWIYCLLKAVHEPTKAIIGFQEVNLEPGQFIFGRRKAAEETGLSEREIRTSQGFCKKAGNLTIKTTNKFSILSIVNWDTYQNPKIENDQQNDQQVTSKRPHTRIKNKRIYCPESAELDLASFLFQEILKNKPDFKEPNLQAWAKEIDLMIRKELRDPTRIRQVIQWAQKDSFWHKNILSTAKLRAQFDRLEMAMGKGSSW